jgi:hypothetical protein
VIDSLTCLAQIQTLLDHLPNELDFSAGSNELIIGSCGCPFYELLFHPILDEWADTG